MFSGPMFRWEGHATRRHRRPFLFRTVFAIVLSLVTLAAGLIVFLGEPGATLPVKMSRFGSSLLVATIGIEILFLMFYVPGQVGGAIAEEREKDTLPLLLLTRLTPFEIVATKAAARWMPAGSLVLAATPFLVAAGWLAGLERESALALVALLSSSAFMTALAIHASAQSALVANARGQAMARIIAWLALPVLSVMPVATGTIWGDLLVEGKRLCILVAPASPTSLLTDNSWYYPTGGPGLGLEARIALMVAMQGGLGLVALGLASTRLQAREPNPNWTDPTRGHRPACGDDPIFWREYEMPIRKGAGPLLLIGLRLIWISVRAVLINLASLIGALVLVGVPIGILVASIYYGTEAFRELRAFGYGPGGTFEARTHFNLLIRAATGMLAFLPAMMAPSLVAARFTIERDKKTWDAFLTTPLTGAETLRSKGRVATFGIWHAAKPLPVLWAVGIALGVVTWWGVALAAADLVLVVWLGVALGLDLGIRPRTKTAITNRSGLISLALFASHGPVVAGALASPRELAFLAAQDARIGWGLALAGLAVPIATALLARRVGRRTFERFDEWAGRPILGNGEPAPTASPVPALA